LKVRFRPPRRRYRTLTCGQVTRTPRKGSPTRPGSVISLFLLTVRDSPVARL
jgi:hypothetical protein